MRRFLIAVLLCVVVASTCFAQGDDLNAPATKEDVTKYMEVAHSQKLVRDMLAAMVKPMHQMIHEQYLKDKDRLPADFEDRMNKMVDDMFSQMPVDQMLDSMVPVYQKHFTKGDLQALTAFYSSPSGQKILREMPAITTEAMQNMMPIMREYMDKMTTNLQTQIAQMKKKSIVVPDSLQNSSAN